MYPNVPTNRTWEEKSEENGEKGSVVSYLCLLPVPRLRRALSRLGLVVLPFGLLVGSSLRSPGIREEEEKVYLASCT